MHKLIVFIVFLVVSSSCGIHPNPSGSRLAGLDIQRIELKPSTGTGHGQFGFISRTEPITIHLASELPNDWQKINFRLEVDTPQWWIDVLLDQWQIWLDGDITIWYQLGDTDFLAYQMENLYDHRETIFLLAEHVAANNTIKLTPHHTLHRFTRYNLVAETAGGVKDVLSSFVAAPSLGQVVSTSGSPKVWQSEAVYTVDPGNASTIALNQIDKQFAPQTLLLKDVISSGEGFANGTGEYYRSFGFIDHSNNPELLYYQKRVNPTDKPQVFTVLKPFSGNEILQLFMRSEEIADTTIFREDYALATRAIYQAHSNTSHVLNFYESANGEAGQFWNTLAEMRPLASIVIHKDERNRIASLAFFDRIVSLSEADSADNNVSILSPRYFYEYRYASNNALPNGSYTSQRSSRHRWVLQNNSYHTDRIEEADTGTSTPRLANKQVNLLGETVRAFRNVNKNVESVEGYTVISVPENKIYYRVQFSKPLPL